MESFFLQILEGQRKLVCETYHSISKDPRHEDVQLISFSGESKRLFSEWSMAYCGDTKKNRKEILTHNINDEFNPTQMSPESILNLILALEFNER